MEIVDAARNYSKPVPPIRMKSSSRKAAWAALPDVIGTGLDVIFCGINPGAAAAIAGHSFVGHTNRFWRVLHVAGFTPQRLLAEEDQSLLLYGCGLTTAVARPTRSGSELTRAELKDAGDALERKIRRYSPRVLAFLGKAAYVAITGQRQVQWGRQTSRLGGAEVWVLPNPSGLNRGFSLGDLIRAYKELKVYLHN
jgi:double-stranded uracil-DNA glycosylase